MSALVRKASAVFVQRMGYTRFEVAAEGDIGGISAAPEACLVRWTMCAWIGTEGDNKHRDKVTSTSGTSWEYPLS